MSPSDPVMRLMRLMVHLNIGATLAIAAWTLWSGWLLASGQLRPAHTPAEIRALAPQAAAVPMQLRPATAAGRAELAVACHPLAEHEL